MNLTKLIPLIVEEASDWFIEFSEGTIDPTERERFDAWLRRSPDHVQAYLRIAMLWEESPLLGKTKVLASDDLIARVVAQSNIVPLASQPSAAPFSPPPSAADSSQPSPAGSNGPLTTARRGRREKIFALAASFLAITTVGAWLYVQRGTYTTAVGEQRSVRLEDGSTVDLNSQTTVRVRFNKYRRAIELLDGQALFQVAKDPARPFVVSTDSTSVRAIGTQFDVYRKNGGTVVTVIEGRVAVLPERPPPADAARDRIAPPAEESPKMQTAPVSSRHSFPASRPHEPTSKEAPTAQLPREGEILLAAGEQVTVAPTAVATPHEADLALATAWTQRKIAFKAAPLSEVADEFNRYNTQQLVILDPGLKATKVSGVFSSADPDSLLRFLRELPNISVEETDPEIRISRK